jgi:anti-anti-sigma regulatory factor
MSVNRINVRDILESRVSNGYTDLVTRHTGRAVRGGIEEQLEEIDSPTAVIDFSAVRCLDISCADEIVGKLLMVRSADRYLMLRGLTEAHCDAIAQVLERHGLAVVAEDRAGQIELLGPLAEITKRAFSAVAEAGGAGADTVARRLDLSADAAREALDMLLELGLVRREADGYRAFTA